MDFFFQDPDEVKLPPEEVRLRLIQVTLQPGSNKVRLHLELTPFQKRPNVEVIITTSTGKEAAHTSILEVMLPKMELTMHLREPIPGHQYSVDVSVYYQRLPEPTQTSTELPLPEPMTVDRGKETFILPLSSP